MMMFLSLLAVLLLTLRTCQVDAAAAPVQTFTHTDPSTGRPVQCERCPPGTYLRSRCTSTQRTVCAPCPSGSFTARWNYIQQCLRCSMCGMNQVVKTACAADVDCECQCAEGFYYKKSYDMCLRHSECPSGEGVQTTGTASDDTVCQICPNGTFSDTASAHLNCTTHRDCGAAGLQQLLRGSVWHDSVCASCQNARDGAHYLREILPSFFAHHKLSVKRLRRALHNLERGGAGAVSELSLPELHRRLEAALASAGHVRQLPDILRKVGAEHAGERLHGKLKRIDGGLKQLCAAASGAL